MAANEYRRLIHGGAPGALRALVELAVSGVKRVGHCRDCGAVFASKQAKRYCDACSSKRQYQYGCDHQKPIFPTTGKVRKYCYACFPKPIKKERKAHDLRYQKICANPECAKEFMCKLFQAKYCSRRCGATVNSREYQERIRDRSPRPCRFCGSVFAPTYGDSRSTYCSTECRKKYGYRATNGTTHRRRARKFGCEYECVDKIEVFERDGWRCKICGIKTPREKMGRKVKDAPELGHIRSLADGGPHSYANVQCECHRCNRIKGSRSMGQLLLPL